MGVASTGVWTARVVAVAALAQVEKTQDPAITPFVCLFVFLGGEQVQYIQYTHTHTHTTPHTYTQPQHATMTRTHNLWHPSISSMHIKKTQHGLTNIASEAEGSKKFPRKGKYPNEKGSKKEKGKEILKEEPS